MLPIGVIEGFYGKVWSWQERHDMVGFLSKNRFSSYWYAPKADQQLRKHWYTNWDEATFRQLQLLSENCNDQQIQFGLGLSPLGLYHDWREGKGRDKLLGRLQQIAVLKPKGLALLFDDMQGDLPGLAETQADIAHFVAAHIEVDQLVLCPSYYSFDPILEQLFGKMPANYWQDLGKLLDPSIDIFWTGDKVISLDYPVAGLKVITELLRRKPVIWDNSIVNDGRKTSPFLNVRAMFNPQSFAENVNGLVINPMNAAALSQIPLSSLHFDGEGDQRLAKSLQLLAPELQLAILDCIEMFNIKGRDNLTNEDVERLNAFFRVSPSSIARDICSWVDGCYQFDPACLT